MGGVCQLRLQMSTTKMQSQDAAKMRPRCGAAVTQPRLDWVSPKGLTKEASHLGYYKGGIAPSPLE